MLQLSRQMGGEFSMWAEDVWEFIFLIAEFEGFWTEMWGTWIKGIGTQWKSGGG